MRHLCFFLLASAASAQQPQSDVPPTGVLTGRVVNSLTGEPIKKAMVELRSMSMPARGQMPGTTTVTTDSTGHFRAADLADGKYMVHASHPAYPLPRQTLAPNDQTEVTVGGPNPTKDLVASLLPGGAIAGRVTDLDGQPLSGAIEVIERSSYNPSQAYSNVGGGRIEEDGAFRIPNLPPGRYYLRVRPTAAFVQPHGLTTDAELLSRPNLEYVAQFFPASLSLDNAEQLTVTAGGNLQGVEMKLAPMPTVSIRGKVTSAGSPPERITIMLIPVGLEGLGNSPFAMNSAGRDGAFTLKAIPKGSYLIKVSSDSNERGYYAQRPVQVGAEAISGLEIPIRESVDVPLTLSSEAAVQSQSSPQGPTMRLDRIMVQPIAFGINMIYPRLKKLEDAKFELQKLTPGKYRLTATSAGYVKSIKWGDRETTGGILEVTGAESGPIQVTISPNFARASGTVQDFRQGAKAVVALIPENDETIDYSSIVMGNVTPSGQFQAQGAPGVYYAVSMEGAGMQQALHPAIRAWVKQHGTRIILDVNTPANAILPIAKRETIEQILNEYAAKNGR